MGTLDRYGESAARRIEERLRSRFEEAGIGYDVESTKILANVIAGELEKLGVALSRRINQLDRDMMPYRKAR